ncbi:unnamed protein product [Caretta caretta]
MGERQQSTHHGGDTTREDEKEDEGYCLLKSWNTPKDLTMDLIFFILSRILSILELKTPSPVNRRSKSDGVLGGDRSGDILLLSGGGLSVWIGAVIGPNNLRDKDGSKW